MGILNATSRNHYRIVVFTYFWLFADFIDAEGRVNWDRLPPDRISSIVAANGLTIDFATLPYTE